MSCQLATPEDDQERVAAFLAEQQSISGLSSTEARTTLDAREDSLLQSLWALRAVRNSLAPIRVLPEEILAEIFAWLMLSFGPKAGTQKLRHHPCFVVTAVCRHWRTVAIATPRLWSLIELGRNHEPTDLFLCRSKSAPIHIRMNASSRIIKIGPLLEPMLPHLSRVRRLELNLYASQMPELSSTMVIRPAPALEVLCLCMNTGRRIVPLETTAVLDDGIFNGVAPKLCQIHMSNVAIPFTSPLFMGLTHLHLYRQSPLVTPPMDLFLEILERCPHLQQLFLSEAGPAVPAHETVYPGGIRPPVVLHDLSSITLRNRPVDIAHLLSHLAIPSVDCKVHISANLEDSSHSLAEALPSDCTQLKCLTELRQLEFTVEGFLCISLRGRPALTEEESFSAMSIVGNGMLKPRIFLSQLGTLLPLPHLEHVRFVNCAAHISSQQWRAALSRFPRLLSLTAIESGDSAQHQQLITALAMTPLETEDDARVVCSRLEILRFSGLSTSPQVLDSLAACYRERLSMGTELKVLHLSDFDDPPNSEFARFRAQVPVVECGPLLDLDD
ncbi:hypothetical protein PLICRDRAFT_253830 [Plicaturopsis crispa FD-325 SS-3]|nr:hypothetical protein PLICRDRAFT_253830 [Plicaturopsis crispa FD-325 SS-3]